MSYYKIHIFWASEKMIKGKKITAITLMCILTLVLLAGCGQSGTSSEPSQQSGSNEAPKVIEIKLGHGSPPGNDRLEMACQEFKKEVEAKTNGTLKVTTYPANQLGGEREQLEGIQMGTIEMGALGTGPIPGIFPQVMVFDLPYLFPTLEVAYKVLDGPVGQKVLDMMTEQTGVRALVWGENGYRHFTSNTKAIKHPDDLKGQKVRLMENPAHMAMVEVMGGNPTPISFAELYTALAQGTVDAQENPLSLTMSMKFYEVQKYLTLDGHVYHPIPLLINDKFYQSLTPEQQKAINEAAITYRDKLREYNQKQTNEALQFLIDQGMEVTELTPEQLQPFRDATRPVYDQFKDIIGEDLLNEVLNAIKEAEAELNQ